jgi:hypothetical protein
MTGYVPPIVHMLNPVPPYIVHMLALAMACSIRSITAKDKCVVEIDELCMEVSCIKAASAGAVVPKCQGGRGAGLQCTRAGPAATQIATGRCQEWPHVTPSYIAGTFSEQSCASCYR